VLVQPFQGHTRGDELGDDVAQRMDPVVDSRVGEPSIGVHVIGALRVDDRLTRKVRREQTRRAVGRARSVIEDVGGRMAFGEIKRSARTQQRRDGLRPSSDVGQPADGAQVTNTMSNSWGGGIAANAS